MSIKTSLLSKEDKSKLDKAVYHELYASNMYKYMGTCMQNAGLFGAEKYFKAESADELEHWEKLTNFANDLGSELEMPKIDAIDFEEGQTILSLFEKAFEVESELGDFYCDFYDSTKDVYVKEFLLGMVKIQRKALGEVGDWIARLKFVGDDKSALLLIDQELGK